MDWGATSIVITGRRSANTQETFLWILLDTSFALWCSHDSGEQRVEISIRLSGLLVSRRQSKSMGYRNGNGNRELQEATNENAHHQSVPHARTGRRSRLDTVWSGDRADPHDPAYFYCRQRWS